ncbi:hypothetical protein C8Q78DRAFT_1067995 [Trametes maxima]|nr:hypothetical protein C8Q78DRAFT_1067995 [Trametes maxima]
MSPVLCSPVSPAGGFMGNPFDASLDTIPYSPSSDSLCPLLPSDAAAHANIFDVCIPEMTDKDSQRLTISSASDMSSGRSSTDEGHIPMAPSERTITHETIRPHKVKKKRSLGLALKALKSSSQSTSDHPKPSKRIPHPLQLEETSLLTVDSDELPGTMGLRREEEDGFEDRNRTVRRRNMPHHPFTYYDVPYMQAYSQILLENDFQTHELLRRLMRTDSPTFHYFGKRPPTEVLDLGCGEGFWVLHAAKMWKSHHTKVTGLDLIDLHNNDVGEVRPHMEPAYTPKNVTWFRANFVKYELPFPDDSFDLVRMANLTLCIPINRWRFVLTEVRRVLKPGGRLELIDDDMFFPRIPPHPRFGKDTTSSIPPKDPASPPAKVTPTSPPKFPPPSPPKFRTQRAPSASRADAPFIPHAASLSRSASLKLLSNARRGALPRPGSPGPTAHALKRHTRSSSEIEYSSTAAIANNIEAAFESMLVAKGISPRPHQFLGPMLREVFGPDCARQTQSLELAVPSRELVEREGAPPLPPAHGAPRRSEEGRPGWMTIEWDTKEKRKENVKEKDKSSDKASLRSARSSEDSALGPDLSASAISPKARQLLFGDDRTSALAARSVGPYQSPGLMILPATFIPLAPLELEMHACKHMNTLLGCKYALSKFMLGQRAPDGSPLLTEREVDDFLWDYECFRRKRFNWPQDVPDIKMEEEPEPAAPPPPPPKPSLFRVGSTATLAEPSRTPTIADATMYSGMKANKDNATHVRTIHVYEAIKLVVPHCGCHHRCKC